MDSKPLSLATAWLLFSDSLLVSYVPVAATPKTDNKTSQLLKLFHARSLADAILSDATVIEQLRL